MFKKAMLAGMISQNVGLMNLFLDGGQGKPVAFLCHYATFIRTLMIDTSVPTALTRVVSVHSRCLVTAGRVL